MQILTKRNNLFLLLIVFLLFCTLLPAQAASKGSLLEPAQLKKWIDSGYRTEKGGRVVILDVVLIDTIPDHTGTSEKIRQEDAQCCI